MNFIEEINRIKPSKTELLSNYDDREYVDYLLSTYDFATNETDYSSIISLISTSNIYKIDFAGVHLNKVLNSVEVEGSKLICIALFQDNYLCINDNHDKLFYIDLEISASPLFECDFDYESFMNLLLLFFKLDVYISFRGGEKNEVTFEILPEYTKLIDLIREQYE
ncbi:hypothetical protein [Flammeovirga sp. SJP92]|uniref:hypothetical protein n=1 Tax=Flammeovirga sp. SJP92 TaxID=1775430 RepID=UPI0012FB1365|nr:hypothetical protein [Flammeovirga sp. SJP92]